MAGQQIFPEWRTVLGSEGRESKPARQVVKRSGEARAAKAYILYRARHEATGDAARLMLDISTTMDGYLA